MPAEARDRISALLPESPVQHLITLVQQARNAEGADRARWSSSLNALLESKQSDAEAWGTVLLELLEDDAFEGLISVDEVPCRQRAVDAVLELGWPWALHLTPADLEALRMHTRGRPSRLQLALAAAALVLIGLWVAWPWLMR